MDEQKETEAMTHETLLDRPPGLFDGTAQLKVAKQVRNALSAKRIGETFTLHSLGDEIGAPREQRGGISAELHRLHAVGNLRRDERHRPYIFEVAKLPIEEPANIRTRRASDGGRQIEEQLLDLAVKAEGIVQQIRKMRVLANFSTDELLEELRRRTGK